MGAGQLISLSSRKDKAPSRETETGCRRRIEMLQDNQWQLFRLTKEEGRGRKEEGGRRKEEGEYSRMRVFRYFGRQ